MPDLALRETLTGLADSGRRYAAPPLPVASALQPLLPDGLRRGSTVHVAGSVSLLLALLGTASAEGAWCALVGLPATIRTPRKSSNGWSTFPTGAKY